MLRLIAIHPSVSICTTATETYGCAVKILRVYCIFLVSLLIGSLGMAEPIKTSKTLESIRKKGVIQIGVKTDFPPFGMLNAKGDPEGFEIDLAADIARQMGVRLVTVSLTTENRFQKLEQGDVDLIIATTADTLERRQIATAIEPNYYAGGVVVFLRPEQRITDWQGMRGQKICATQGAYFNRPMSQRYLLDLLMYRNTRDALLALRDGRCIGFLYSSAAVQAYLKKPEWAGYKSPLPLAMVAPWAINISRKEDGTELDHMLGDFVAKWHRSGFLIEREKAWGVQPTKFLKDEQTLWSQRGSNDGPYVCERDNNQNWPTACRNPTFVRSTEVGGLLKLGLWLQESTGINLTFVYDGYDRTLFVKGMLYTVALMVGCVFFSLILGVIGAFWAESRLPLISRLVRGMAIYGRMTPPLLQMYMVFFGVGAWLWVGMGISVSPMWVAIWCLSYYTGSSVMFSLMDSVEHIRLHQPDFHFGLSSFTNVVESSAGPVKAALINVVKQSILASAIAVPELISATTSIMSDQGNVNVMMNVFLLVFLLFISAWIRFFDWFEQKLIARHKAHYE
jgi:polar amino acid transport system substrate-binding protein